MTAARHANDTRVEAQRLHLHLVDVCARHQAGQPVEYRDLLQALQLARITEYHASRTQVAIGHTLGREADKPTSQEKPSCL